MRATISGLASCAVIMASASIQASDLEEVFVNARKTSLASARIDTGHNGADIAELLKQIPGANVNQNGALTGIAQYRGLYGDRIAIQVDGGELVTGGPNAMDTPLSYTSPMITDGLTITRGITSVSKAPESLGGLIQADLARGEFGDEELFDFDGKLGMAYGSNGDLASTATRLSTRNRHHRLSVLSEINRADDIETPEGAILPSELRRDRYDLSYGFRDNERDLLIYGGYLDTRDTGTPALGMDIITIETQLFGLDYRAQSGAKLSWRGKIAVNDVDHVMDNFSLRTSPASPMAFRQNFAEGRGGSLSLHLIYDSGPIDVTSGLDFRMAAYDSTISNPNNAVFSVLNFNDATRDLASLFVELGNENVQRRWELGLRYKRVSTDASEVAAMGMMGAMADNVALLAQAFNDADRKQDFDTVDVVAKYGLALAPKLELLFELGSKTRAPSHQELFLWLPLQATAGLADGRNYVGNLDLDAERANEVVAGLDWRGSRGWISPQFFFKRIDDFIQGAPSNDATANTVAQAMGGTPALQFTNVDAEIYGVDLAWYLRLGKGFFLDGTVSLLRGERRDVDDNLYRQSPDSLHVALHYQRAAWRFSVENWLYDRQDNVAVFNGEQETAGYGLLNVQAAWQPRERLALVARINNLVDKTYQDHLAGINRVADAPIPRGDRLYGPERNLSLSVQFGF